MIVDDEPEMFAIVQSFLQHDEYEIMTANNSRQALELLGENKGKSIDLILIDTPIPGTGKTGFFSMKPESRISTAKPDTFIQKPFTKEQLREFVKQGI